MVDVSDKDITKRVAIASGKIFMQSNTLTMIKEGSHKKGDVLSVAQVAGIMASKKTSELIPMCHNLNIEAVNISFSYGTDHIKATSEILITGKTGVEMETLVAVSNALLTIYDMCKAVDKEMVITDIQLLEKKGGSSGHYRRK